MNKKMLLDGEISRERLFEELAIEFLSKKYGIKVDEILKSKQSIETNSFPLTILSQGLSSLEAIVKYLRENKKLSYEIIGKLLSRNSRTLTVTYNIARRKHPQLLIVDEKSEQVPLNVFNDYLSVLESIVKHLHDSGYNHSQIGRLLDKDPRTIWTVYHRVKIKLKIR